MDPVHRQCPPGGKLDLDAKPSRPRRSWSAPAVLGVALLLTALVTTLVQRMEAMKDGQRFQNAVERTRDSIGDRVEDDLALLRSVAGLLAAHPALDRAAFHAYAAQVELKRRPLEALSPTESRAIVVPPHRGLRVQS